MKTDGTIPTWLCTIGAAMLAIATGKDQFAGYLIIPELVYVSLLLVGSALTLAGVAGLFLPSMRRPIHFIVEKVRLFLGKIMDIEPSARYKCVYASEADLLELHRIFEKAFGSQSPPVKLMRSWIRVYPKALAMLYRVDKSSPRKTQQTLVGSFKVLPITEAAAKNVAKDRLTGSTIRPQHIARKSSDTAAYYVGDVVAFTGRAKGTLLAYLNATCEQAIKMGVPIYARPLTEEGKRVMTQYGFVQCSDDESPPAIGQMCKFVPGREDHAVSKALGSRGKKGRAKRLMSSDGDLRLQSAGSTAVLALS